MFPQTGAILRHHFGGERETQLHIVAGSNHAHYDYDSGSITIWGKGRLIADDFGYEGRAPASDHSMVDSPHAAAIMQPEAFAAGPHLDYFRGRSGGWTRHVLMIKDQDPLGPNYYVLRDRLVGQKGGRWRLWLTGASVRQEPPMVRVVGSEDVDTDIALLSDKALPAVLETISRRSGSSGLQNNPMTTTQTSVILTLPGPDQAMSTLVYPRHKNEPEPLMSQALNGRVVTLRSQHGTDTIFVSGEQFSYQRDGISFEGTIGAVLDRFGRRQLVLGAPGTIAAGDERLTAGADSFPAVAR